MTKCTTSKISFPPLKSRKIEVNFEGGDITSDGGVFLLRQIDRKLGLTKAVSKLFPDNRQPGKVTHSVLSMIRQRIYGLALGYEDLNDQYELRHDIGLQTAVESLGSLASAPTLSRFENSADRAIAVNIHDVMIDQFIASFKKPPRRLVLDFDATDDPVHGEQVNRFFHGYYRHYCFLPLQVFCNKQLLVSYLRPSNQDQAKHSWAILSLLVKKLRQVWPHVEIVFRGDCGFNRQNLVNWCEAKGIKYIIGQPRNNILQSKLASTVDKAQKTYNETKKKQRLFTQFQYAAKTWKRERKIIGKAEYSVHGENTRFIVTNLEGDAQQLYDDLYCARGDMENQIKQLQLELFSDRTSCHEWWANQFRLLLSSLAFILIERLRAIGLRGTILANAQAHTIRVKLFKVGGVVISNTRRIRLLLASACPYQNLFANTARRLSG